MTTRFGKIKSVNDLDGGFVSLNGAVLHIAKSARVQLLEVYPLGERDAVLFFEKSGGSGSAEEFKFITINDRDDASVFSDPRMVSQLGRASIRASSNELLVDLGYERGKKKFATFDGAAIKIEFVADAEFASIEESDCAGLFNHALPECRLSADLKASAEICHNAFTNLSSSANSWVQALGHNPAFSELKFAEYCVAVCETRKPPPLKQFLVDVCAISKNAK